MLPLDAAEWRELRHAYGPASDVPELLRKLEKNPSPKSKTEDEPWFTLWSSLCHQGDAYSASYAAVPHIIHICLKSIGPIDFGFFLLPASIEIARETGHGPKLPDGLSKAYFESLNLLHDCAAKHASEDWDDSMAISVAAALAAAKGRIRVAQAIANLDSHIIDRIIEQDW